MGRGARRTPGGGRSLAGRYGKVGVGASARACCGAQGSGLCPCERVRGSAVPAERERQGKGGWGLSCWLTLSLLTWLSFFSALLSCLSAFSFGCLLFPLCLLYRERVPRFSSPAPLKDLPSPQGAELKIPREKAEERKCVGGKTIFRSHFVVTAAGAG